MTAYAPLVTRIAMPLLLLALAACADDPAPRQIVWATTKPIVGPDGSRAWVIECRTSIGYCYEMAGRQCPRGYEVLNHDGHEGAIASTERTSRSTAETRVTPTFRGSMLVKCKTPPMAAASSAPASTPASSSSAPISRDAPF